MSNRGPRVLVIGAQGALGRLCVPQLRAAGLDVIRAGRRPESASDFRLLDLDDTESVPEACADVDLVISMVYDTRRSAERHVLSEGGAMFSLVVAPEERAELRAMGAGARGLIVTDVGLGPGVTSIVFKSLLDRHPDADGLENFGTFSTREPAGRGTAEEFTYPALTSARRHPIVTVDFPEPYGPSRCIGFTDPEVSVALIGSLAERLSATTCGYFIEQPERGAILALNRVGLLSRMPLAFFTFGAERQASKTTAKPQCHICGVRRGGERLAASVVSGEGNFQMTAAAIAVKAAALLARAEDTIPSGVRGVEEVFELAEVRPGLEERGVRIEELA